MESSDLGYSHSGLQARSPEGHAAKAMHIRGDEFVWVEIQEKTFTNWVNENLKAIGLTATNLQTDFCDGLKLIALIEVLQKKKLKKIRKPLNQHQYLENVQTALNAMAADNIKLVNIGNTDIVEGNLKLILGLVWSLILRYQIGRTNFPPKKLMLAWLQAVLPDMRISNFTSDWNDGVALSALLDYCRPGLFPNWKTLSVHNRVENCQNAMTIAREEFDIPMILTPEHLASPNLDELSGMTYLSYYMKDGGPGYNATLAWIRKQLPHLHIQNFTSDWNDGVALCALVRSLGAQVSAYPNMGRERSQWESNIQQGLNGGKYLGVEPLLKAKEIADTEVEHLGVMAYVARFQWTRPKKSPSEKISITGTDLNNVHVNKPAHFRINLLDSSVDLKTIRAEVKGPNGNLECRLNLSKTGGTGIFIPHVSGKHELIVYCDGEIVSSCPLDIIVHPDISRILFSGIDPCALGSIVEVLINSSGAGSGNVLVEAIAPSGKSRECPVNENDGVYTATFTPNEIGEWKISVTYSSEHIQGSPFTCYVYDPTQVQVRGLDHSSVGKETTFVCDCSHAGWGEVKIDVQYQGRSLPLQLDERGNGVYRVTFTPTSSGNHKVNVTFNGAEIKGSPYSLYVLGEGMSKMDSAIRQSKEDLSIHQRSKLIHSSKEFLSTDSSSTQKIGGVLRVSHHGSAESDSSSRHSEDLISVNTKKHIGSSRDNIHSSTKEESEGLTFRQRAELLHNSLSFHQKETSGARTPKIPPPTAKKPSTSSADVTTKTWDTRDQSTLSGIEKMTIETKIRTTRESASEDQRKSTSDIVQELKQRDDFSVKSKNDLVMKSTEKLVTSNYSRDGSSESSKNEQSENKHVTHSTREVKDMSNIASKYKKGDIFQVVVGGDGLKLVPVKRPATFTVNARGFDQDDISVTVTAPSGRDIPIRMDTLSPGQYEVEYISPEVGEHLIDVHINKAPLRGSPFHCFAYDATKIHVGKIPNGVVGKPVEFEIEGSEAGSGNLEILVNGGHVTSQVKNLGNHRFLASFIPHAATTHTIEMKFNGEQVPGSPWRCDITEPTRKVSVKGDGLHSFSTGRSTSFEICTAGFRKEDIRVTITGPNKNIVQYRLIELHNDTYKVEFKTFEVGTYSVEVLVAGQKVPGSPFLAKSYDASRIQISDIPRMCFVGQTYQFQVDASQAGEGQLEISVNDGAIPNQVQVLSSGKCLVSFRPEVATTHKVDIKFNSENVLGCPLMVDVTEASQTSVSLSALELIPIGQTARFTVNGKNCKEDELKVTITSPSQTRLPVKVSNGKGGLAVEFVPKEVGSHLVVVEYGGLQVSGSPYTIKVYDSQKVDVSGSSQGTLGQTVQITVDASLAGEGNLEITVSSRGRNIPTQVHPLGSAKFGVSFIPTEPSDHVISISFNKEPVTGSPFRVVISESGTIVPSGPSSVSATINKTASFVIQNVSGKEQDLNVQVEGPQGATVPCTLRDNGNGTVRVNFSPDKTGEHKINVSYQNSPIPGSPFITKVYDIKQIKVRDIPIGVVGKPITFLVETANAGPGNLEVMVNSGQVPTTAEAQSSTLYAITFVPKEVRPHLIDLKFNGETVPGCPYECNIVDPGKIKISGEGLERVPVNRATSFMIDTHGINMGDIKVSIDGPNQKQIKEYIHGNHHSGYRVEYTPAEVGDHTVDVRLQDIHIGGSPFLVKAYDSSRVKVTDVGNGVVGKPVYFSLDASQAGAGNLEIIVSVSGRNVPNYVQSEGNAKFRVNFKPTEAQTHMLSVKFNSEPVPGSPFYVKVSDSNQSVITGSSLRMTSLARGAQFTIDTCGMDKADCKVIVTGPTGKNLPVTLTKTTGTAYQAQFSPSDIGPHHVVVLLDGSPITGSPFTCNVYDVNKVRVSKLSPGSVGKPVTFQVDASQAGEGTLELVVTTRKSSVRAEVSMKSRGLYDVTFIPQEKTSHYVNITFNDEDVAGSPFKIDVKDGDVSSISGSTQNLSSRKSSTSSTLVVKGEGIKQGLVGSTNVFEIDTNGLEGDVDAKITGPTGVPIPNKFHEMERGFYKVEYVSREIGSHKIEVFHRGSPLYSKPFLVEVSDPSRVKLVDVEDGIVGREQVFKVDASRAGRGSLSIFITTGGREVKHVIKELGTGVHQVSYHPRTDLPHKIDVYFNGHQAPGCPQIVEIRDPSHSIIAHGAGLKAASVSARTTFLIETGGVGEAKDFDILVSSPNGAPLPVKCYQQKDRSLLVEWVAQHVGTHRLEVLFIGKPIAGSPFSCQVFDSSKVSLQKIKSTTFCVNERISLALSRREAGYAELDVTVTSPLGRHLPIEVKGTPDGDGELIEFTPTVPGKYKIAITYGGVEVPGSPITFIAQDGKAPEVSGNGLTHAQVGVPSTFKINAAGLYGKPEVRVDGPDTEAETSIEEEEDGVFVVTYKPEEVGVFDVKVLWNSREIPGSPLHPKVVNPAKVRIIGGWESISDTQGRVCLTVGEEKRIPIDVGDAGPGKLKIEVRSPAGMAETHLEQMGSHKYRLCFVPHLEGEHYIYMYFADLPLPKSPFLAYAEEITAAPDHTKVVLRGHGLAAARIAEEAEFIIDGSEAGAGNPEVSLTGVKADIPVQLQLLGNNLYKALYTPLVPGAYLLNVLWSERQVKGCPFKVNVTANCDSGKVICSGDGLRGGAVGKEIKAFIDTRKAGPGELTAHCMGPHKVAYCELYDHRDGTFTLYLKPQEGGRHALTVKYGGDHVPGSPFTLRIAGAPDASKVRVYGPGIEPGVLATYQSRFICDTRGAGAGQLTVRIRGPKGAFRVEMQRESQKDRTILCKYDPTEPGDYRLEVKWSGEHVPGSPFMVMIFDTQEELNRYVQSHYNQPLGQGGMISSDYYGGSMVYSTGFGQMSWRGSTAEL